MIKKALIISTGGTIVSVEKGEGAEPDESASKSIVGIAKNCLRERGCTCEAVAAFGSAGYDSSDISPREWLALTAIINAAVSRGVKKVLVIHGTDTMAYTAAWLSLTVPADTAIVLTGSQRPRDARDFDGITNINCAVKSLCKHENGVYINFAAKDFRAPYVHKEDAQGICAYATTTDDVSVQLARVKNIPSLPYIDDWQKVAAQMCVMHIHPTIIPSFSPCKILILVGYGAGNIPQRVRENIRTAYANCEKPVIIAASSCARGAKSPSSYGGVGMAGLTKDNFLVFNQGKYSIEFLIALSYLTLLISSNEPEKILGSYLEKL